MPSSIRPAAVSLLLMCAATPLAGQPSRPAPNSPVFGLHVGAPASLSIAGGVMFRRRILQEEIEQGYILIVEPGLRAGRISAGYASIAAFGGYSFRASALRTWRSPGRNWIGAEVHGSPIGFFGARLGAFRTLGGGAGRTMLVGDVNFFL